MLTDEQMERNDVVDNAAFALLNKAYKLKRFVNVFNGDFDTQLAELFHGFTVELNAEQKEAIRTEAATLAEQMHWDEDEKSLEWDMYYIAQLLDTLESFVPEQECLDFRPYSDGNE